MAEATLTISSKNYSSWSLRGWLLCRMAGLDFDEEPVATDDAEARQELLLLTPSVRVPRLTNGNVTVWDTLAIAEYLAEIAPKAGLLPADQATRAHCRAVSGEMHSGFYNLRSALPMNLKARHEFVQNLFRRPAGCRAHQNHLDRLPAEIRRSLSLRLSTHSRRRDVRAGVHPLPDLCGAARTRAFGLLRGDLPLAVDAGVDPGRAHRAG